MPTALDNGRRFVRKLLQAVDARRAGHENRVDRRARSSRMRFWNARSRKGKIGLAVAAVLLVVFGIRLVVPADDKQASEPAALPSATFSTARETAGEPAAIAGQGYSVVMDEEFDSLTPAWGSLWWQPDSPPNSTYVQDGVLNLVSRRAQGYQDISLSTESAKSSGRWRQGYFEARMRWTKGAGAWPAFWLSSYAHSQGIDCPPMNAELDIFEGQGTEPTVYYGTLHKDTNSLCGVSDETNDGYQMGSIDLTAGFHTYAALWTTADVIWYLDGVEVTRTPTYVSTDQEMYIILQMWTGGWTSGTNATTPDELRTEVDWVRVWQR